MNLEKALCEWAECHSILEKDPQKIFTKFLVNRTSVKYVEDTEERKTKLITTANLDTFQSSF